MASTNYKALEKQYQKELFGSVVPFWEKYSIDTEMGGYFSCLDRDGRVYDTDKFIWLQAREVWTFSMLYNKYEKNSKWLELAKHGIDFLRKYGRDQAGNWYFALRRDGAPLVQPYNIFSDCFAALAFGEYSLATGDEECKDISLKTYNNILKRADNPKGKYTKTIGVNRPLKSFSLPMILANLTLELKWMFGDDAFISHSKSFLSEIMDSFLDKEKLIVKENVLLSGEPLDSFEGRLVNPGHGIEGMSFVMDVANELGDKVMIKKAVEVVLSTLEFSWDEKYGGIFYFMDSMGKPPLQLEWDQKLWWVHLETLVALLKGYHFTHDIRCLKWYEKVHNYSWGHFPDVKYGEWFGYLNRQGDPLLYIKGGKWKGFFHVPRSLFISYQLLKKIR